MHILKIQIPAPPKPPREITPMILPAGAHAGSKDKGAAEMGQTFVPLLFIW